MFDIKWEQIYTDIGLQHRQLKESFVEELTSQLAIDDKVTTILPVMLDNEEVCTLYQDEFIYMQGYRLLTILTGTQTAKHEYLEVIYSQGVLQSHIGTVEPYWSKGQCGYPVTI